MNVSLFHGKLLDGERVVIRRVSGVYEEEDERASGLATWKSTTARR